MKACIICFGDEILTGSVVNTNAAYISKSLFENGINVQQQLTLSDFDEYAEKRLRDLSKQFDVIVCSGGLGPTVDDMTRQIFAKLAGTEIYFDEAVFQDLVNRFGDESYHKIQAMLPKGVKLLNNVTGTAKGLFLKVNTCMIFAVPGVPHEMKAMLLKEVLPEIQKNQDPSHSLHEKTLCFFDIIEVELDPHLKNLSELYKDVKFGIYPSYGVVKVTTLSKIKQDIDKIEAYFFKQFPNKIFATSSEKIEKVLFDYLKERNLTVAFAESITGGDVARRLVAIPGVSTQFLGSFVTYSNILKQDILGVSHETLMQHGAVSEETVKQMLLGAFSKSGADCAIAVTGIAGPSGSTENKPIGLVYIAVGLKGSTIKVHKCLFKGDREMIIEKSSTYAFGYLLNFLKQNQ